MEEKLKEKFDEIVKFNNDETQIFTVSETMNHNLDLISMYYQISNSENSFIKKRDLTNVFSRFVIGTRYHGMGHVMVLAYDFTKNYYFTFIGGGSNSYDRLINWLNMFDEYQKNIEPETFFSLSEDDYFSFINK